MRVVILTWTLISFLGCETAFAASAEQIARGRGLSVQLCASCHQISLTQKPPMRVYDAKSHSDVAALTFMEISAHNGRDARFLETTLDEPHYPMLRRSLSNSEKQDIIAYIQSLGSK